MKEFPWNFGMRLMSSIPLVSYIISPQMSLWNGGNCMVNTNKSRVKRIATRQDENMETYASVEGDVEESDPWDLFQWLQCQYSAL